jgi:hypothetical protein
MLVSMLAVGVASYAAVSLIVAALAFIWKIVLDWSPSSMHRFIK